MVSKRHQNSSIWCPRIHFFRFLWILVGLFFGCAFGGRWKARDSHGGYLPGLEGIALGPGSVVVADIYIYIYIYSVWGQCVIYIYIYIYTDRCV